MRHFTKTLFAAALLAGSGASQAAISTGLNAEIFLQVYNNVAKATFDLDLGITVNDIAGSLVEPMAIDLSQYNDWTDFVALSPAFTAANTKFGVVGGAGTTLVFTSIAAAKPNVADSGFDSAVGSVESQAIAINRDNDNSQNNSLLVLDTDAAGTGQWNAEGGALKTLYGSISAANAAVNYGAAGKFYSVVNDPVLGGTTSDLLGTWTLAGNNLIYAPVATVPLPAAVWLFGAGLMSILGFNRRKVAA